MIFKSNKFPSNLFEGKKILDIGCGRNKTEGAIGLDHADLPGVDIVCNLNEPLPVENESFDIVVATQVLEHVENVIALVYEVHRVLKPGGLFIVHCPYFRSSWAWIDPTHIRAFTVNSLDYFCESTWIYTQNRFKDYGFSTIDVYLDRQEKNTFCRNILSNLCLKYPFKYENSFLSHLYIFEEISYILKK